MANPAYCSGASDGTATAFATSGGGLDRQASLAKVDVVVNATGLGSFKLGGVEDGSMYPARGQTVLVGNEAPFMGCTSGTSDGDEERCYAMTRAAGRFLFLFTLYVFLVSFVPDFWRLGLGLCIGYMVRAGVLCLEFGYREEQIGWHGLM